MTVDAICDYRRRVWQVCGESWCIFADMSIPRLMSSKVHDREDLIQSILKYALVYRWVYMSSIGNVYCLVVSRNASVTVI